MVRFGPIWPNATPPSQSAQAKAEKRIECASPARPRHSLLLITDKSGRADGRAGEREPVPVGADETVCRALRLSGHGVPPPPRVAETRRLGDRHPVLDL